MGVKQLKGRAAFQDWEDLVGDFVDGEVFADVPLRGFPHEGAFRRVQPGQEGAVALRGPKGGFVGDRLVEPTCGWVNLGRGGGQPKGGHALAVLY